VVCKVTDMMPVGGVADAEGFSLVAFNLARPSSSFSGGGVAPRVSRQGSDVVLATRGVVCLDRRRIME
jgi:hypothetical protein